VVVYEIRGMGPLLETKKASIEPKYVKVSLNEALDSLNAKASKGMSLRALILFKILIPMFRGVVFFEKLVKHGGNGHVGMGDCLGGPIHEGLSSYELVAGNL
jgi:hypothetical protein